MSPSGEQQALLKHSQPELFHRQKIIVPNRKGVWTNLQVRFYSYGLTEESVGIVSYFLCGNVSSPRAAASGLFSAQAVKA